MNAIRTQPPGSKEEALIGVLDAIRPCKASASELMVKLRLAQEQTGFVEFIHIVIRARKLLERNGFRLMRTGGTPLDDYWIEPHGLSS